MTPNVVMRTSDMITMRDYVDLRFEEFQRAVDKAEKTMCDRLDGMNEFRDQLKDQAALFVTKGSMDPIMKDIRDLREAAKVSEGKASQNSVVLAYIGSIIGIILGVISIFGK